MYKNSCVCVCPIFLITWCWCDVIGYHAVINTFILLFLLLPPPSVMLFRFVSNKRENLIVCVKFWTYHHNLLSLLAPTVLQYSTSIIFIFS